MTSKSKAAKSKAVVGYVRVSSQEQADNGQSLEAQSERIRYYCEMRGLVLGEIVVDAGVSGGTPINSRDGGAKVLEALKSGRASGVVAVKLDRLFRSAADCLATVESWDKSGVALHLVDMGGQTVDTSTSSGKLFLTMLSGFAEFERNIGGERTSAVLQAKKARGEFTGGAAAPYGFVQNKAGKLEPIPSEQATIKRTLELDADGLSLRAIAAKLASEGKFSRSGKEFAAQQIKAILLADVREVLA